MCEWDLRETAGMTIAAQASQSDRCAAPELVPDKTIKLLQRLHLRK